MEFWKLLLAGQCSIRDIPPDRFDVDRYYDRVPGTRGRIISRQGGYIDDVRGFDANFFHISPREAVVMDPQHRHLMEVAFQALEDAGMPRERYDGVNAGVFIGLFTSDYRERILKLPGFDLDVYSEIGSTRSSASGRVSHALNLTGPSIALDAACASSLVAVHEACRAIWSGEVPFALAGGCNIILEPETTICFSRSRMLSPQGRCQFGDANANGFVRSEGIGVIVLKPLSRAINDQDRIYAVIRATACNNDARLGDGMYMTPSDKGQEALLRGIYEVNGIDKSLLRYCEAHGTGTQVGDPVECGAIARVLGRDRDQPLYVGSVKSNIGHTEGAAGIASLIKTALILYHRTIPPSLHLVEKNPDIPWQEGHLDLPTTPIALPQAPAHLAGVSSFGLSGTNAHAALESFEPPKANDDRSESEPTVILAISGYTPEALRERACQMQVFLESAGDGPTLRNICYTASVRRSHLGHRFAAVGSSSDELREVLAAFGTGGQSLSILTEPKIVFVFSGQGGQWAGMGRGLMTHSPVFRSALHRLDELFIEYAGWSATSHLVDPAASWTSDISLVQPLVFAIQVALCEFWKSCGIEPYAVVGHSMGEVAAAQVAGALDIHDAVRIIVARSTLLASIRGEGGMMVVGLPEQEAIELTALHPGRVSVAVVNGPATTVLSGDPETLTLLENELKRLSIYCSRVDVDVASHSPQVDKLLGPLIHRIGKCGAAEPRARICSTVAGDFCNHERFKASYWAENLRSPVRFLHATHQLLDDGCNVFLEIGPHPVLLNALTQTVKVRDAKAVAIPSVRRDVDEFRSTLHAVASLFTAGAPICWEAVSQRGRCVSLPPYPFQHDSYWIEESDFDETKNDAMGARRLDAKTLAHPLLPRHFRFAPDGTTRVWELPLSTRLLPYLAEHRVRGSALFPAAAYVEMALAAVREAFDGQAAVIECLELVDYLTVSTKQEHVLQLVLESGRQDPQAVRQNGDSAEIFARFFSLDATGPNASSPRLHARARLRLQLVESRASRATAGRRRSTATGCLLEQLRLAQSRHQANRFRHIAVLSILVAADAAPYDGDMEERIRFLLRKRDLVYALNSHHFAVILKNMTHPDLDSVARRLCKMMFADRITMEVSERPNVLILGRIVPDDVTPEELMEDLIFGRLPMIGGMDMEPGALEQTPRVWTSLDVAAFFQSMEARGIVYGPLFRAVQRIERSGSCGRATVIAPDSLQPLLERHLFHPALLDACIQGAIAPFVGEMATAKPGDSLLPIRMDRITPGRMGRGPWYIQSWLQVAREGEGDAIQVNFTVSDEERRVCLDVEGLVVKRFDRHEAIGSNNRHHDWYYRWRWDEMPPVAEHQAPAGTWLLIGPSNSRMASLQHVIQAGNQACDVLELHVDPFDPESIEAWVLSRLKYPLLGIVVLLSSRDTNVRETPTQSTDVAGLELNGNEVLTQSMEGSLTILACLRAKLADAESSFPGVWGVSLGAFSVVDSDEVVTPSLAPPWGLARVIHSESPAFLLRMVDLPRNPTAVDYKALFEALNSLTSDDEMAIRNGCRFGHRLERRSDKEFIPKTMARVQSASLPFRVMIESGSVSKIQRSESLSAQKTEAVVRVEAAATDTGSCCSSQARFISLAGTVVQYGRDLDDLSVGQRVAALVEATMEPSAIERYSNIERHRLAMIPDGIDFPSVAWICQNFLLPWLALGHSSAKTVLVHSAAGSLGFATSILAHRLGMRVIATAASFEIRDQLRSHGIVHVLDDEVDEISEITSDLTKGKGVELVVNSGNCQRAIDLRSVLASGGRLVDLAGSSYSWAILTPSSTGNLLHQQIDLLDLNRHRPGDVREAIEDLLHWTHDLDLGMSSLRSMLALSDLGILNSEEPSSNSSMAPVICLDTDTVTIEHALDVCSQFDSDATYLVTGGCGGLGLSVAEWLIRRGAVHLVLVSRRPGSSPPLDALRAQVVEKRGDITVLAADVANEAEITAVLEYIDQNLAPLRGVFHLAGVLDDATLENQSVEHFSAAMAPKVLGSWHLHCLTRRYNLTHFVLFSSVATTIGSPGQANYAAANTFLDSLAQYRHQLHLPAVSIGWGTWGETGLAAKEENRGGRLEARGLLPMSTADAITAMEQSLICNSPPWIGIFSMNWARWAEAFPSTRALPRLSLLVPPYTQTESNDPEDLAESLRRASEPDQNIVLQRFLRRLIAEVLRMPESRVTLTTSLGQLGMDSLMAVELRSRLEGAIGVEYSPTRILAAPNIVALAQAVLEARSSQVQPASPTARLRAAESAQSLPRAIVTLPAEIRMPEAMSAPRQRSGTVFLTGATGFVGAHLLRALLDMGDVRIVCLVRAPDREAAWQRVYDALGAFELWTNEGASRLQMVAGDIGLERFGLSEAAFAELASSIDDIYHCSAWVNHVYPYERLEAVNVFGTQEVLRLAALGAPAKVHHISTLGVLPYTPYLAQHRVFDEVSPNFDQWEPFFAGYSESKWMAEQLVRQASDRGLPVAIYRAGALTGSHRMAVCPENDTIWRMVRAAIDLGAVPKVARGIGLTPVDAFARALLHLSRTFAPDQLIYHVFSEQRFPISEVIRMLSRLGYDLSQVSISEWAQQLARASHLSSAVAPLRAAIHGLDLQALDAMRIDTKAEATLARLEPKFSEDLAVTPELMLRYLEHFMKIGYFPEPGPRASQIASVQAATSVGHDHP